VLLEIVHAEREGVEILTLHGGLTLGPEDLVFIKVLIGLLHARTTRVVLNFTDLRSLDSTGLGTLVLAAAELRKLLPWPRDRTLRHPGLCRFVGNIDHGRSHDHISATTRAIRARELQPSQQIAMVLSMHQ
jgi:hypothetical protein